MDEYKPLIRKLAEDWFNARKDAETLKQFEAELESYLHQQLIKARVEELRLVQNVAVSWLEFGTKAYTNDRLNQLQGDSDAVR